MAISYQTQPGRSLEQLELDLNFPGIGVYTAQRVAPRLIAACSVLSGAWGTAEVVLRRSLDGVTWYPFTPGVTWTAPGVKTDIDATGAWYVGFDVTVTAAATVQICITSE